MGLASLPVPEPLVRPAETTDVDQLIRLFDLAKEELEGRKGAWLWERHNSPFADALRAAQTVLLEPWIALIGSIDSTVLGYLVGRIEGLHRDGTLGVIHGLYVEPDARGVGIADALVAEAIDRFRSLGCVGVDSWSLPGERETKNFYEAHGFTARSITVHHSFLEPKHVSRTDGLRQSLESG
jgi:GNAT superfamily N-acetyltransferase